MAGPSWLIDSNRIATKIKSASESCDPKRFQWTSNPSRPCPKCNYVIDNSDVAQDWPGLPRGVKFDPSDQELLWHLIAKVGEEDLKPHPFIDEFIPTVDKEDGICYTHPQNLPGLKQDGSVAHFFHRTIKAYNTGTRKRRKIHDLGDVRWHKTGRTKPVLIDGVHKGCKKIMVLYICNGKREKPEKTNWVMHQYHLGIEEDEKDVEFVVSKIFYQQQPKLNDKNEQDLLSEINQVMKTGVDPITPTCITPNPPRCDKSHATHGTAQTSSIVQEQSAEEVNFQENIEEENEVLHDGVENFDDEENPPAEEAKNFDDEENPPAEEAKWWDGESQLLLDSQQLVEGLSICDEILQGSSYDKDGVNKIQPCLSDYAQIGVDVLKKDLEECQKLDFDPSNIELDTPPDFRLSQLEFGSQDSYLAWGGEMVAD